MNRPCNRVGTLERAGDVRTAPQGDLVKRALVVFCVLMATMLVPTLGSAQVTPAAGFTPPDDTQSIGVGAVVFYDYTFTKAPKTTDAAGNARSRPTRSTSRGRIST